METTIRKQIHATNCTWDGEAEIGSVQLVSSSICSKPSKNFTVFECVDGMFIVNLLPGLKTSDGAIDINLHISTEPLENGVQVWMFAPTRYRSLTRSQPRDINPEEGSCSVQDRMYLDEWTSKDYFPELHDPNPIPVWIQVERIN